MLYPLMVARPYLSKGVTNPVPDYRELMAQVAQSGDKDAFQALFVHFGPRIKAMMMKAGADAPLAEDIVQDVMLTVWRKAALYYQDRGSLSAWIFAIARNARIDRLRRGAAAAYVDILELDLPSTEDNSEAQTVTRENADHVAQALRTLPREQREIVEMAFMDDMSHSEIAEKLSIPFGTVKSRMRLAYAKMKIQLEVLQ